MNCTRFLLSGLITNTEFYSEKMGPGYSRGESGPCGGMLTQVERTILGGTTVRVIIPMVAHDSENIDHRLTIRVTRDKNMSGSLLHQILRVHYTRYVTFDRARNNLTQAEAVNRTFAVKHSRNTVVHDSQFWLGFQSP